MAGHGPYKFIDPAVERFDRYRETNYLRFRWTPSNIRAGVLAGIVFPTAIYLLASSTDSRWKWTGTLKTESLSIKPE
ncbi:hypothetical protein DFS33DRAFT_1293777 [Desarmillaria ectypa]|nr:hypothetical protein DFS33DRAFT_1293777 [Desarmillaria ectypa]